MFVSSRGVRVMTSSTDVDAFLADMVETLKARSYARSEVTDFRVKQMSSGIALVIVSRIRYTAHGDRLVAAVHNPITPV